MNKNDFESKHCHYNLRLIQYLSNKNNNNIKQNQIIYLPFPIDARTSSTPFCRLTFANNPKLNRVVKFLYGDVYPST